MAIEFEDQGQRAVQASASVVVVVVEACEGKAEEWQRRMMKMVLLQERQDQIDGRLSWGAAAAALGSH